MQFHPNGEGIRRLNEYLEAERRLSEFVGRGKNLSAGEIVVPRHIDQAYLDEFDSLVKVRDTTESAYRAWLVGRFQGATTD